KGDTINGNVYNRIIYNESKFGNGCDNYGPGTIAKPKCYPNKFEPTDWSRNLYPGDTVIFRESSAGYPSLLLKSSGKAGAPITIMPYSGEKLFIKTTHTAGIHISQASYINIEGPIEINSSIGHVGILVQGAPDYQTNPLRADNIKIHNCRIYGKGNGIWLQNVNNSEVENCIIGPMLPGADHVNGMEMNGLYNSLIKNVEAYGAFDNRGCPANSDADGFHLEGRYDGTVSHGGRNITMINCTAHNNYEDGFDMTGEVTLINSKSYNNYGAGIKVFQREQDNHTLSKINSLSYHNGYCPRDLLDGNPGVKNTRGPGLNISNSIIYGNLNEGVNIQYYYSGGSSDPIEGFSY
ncbi:MAG: right-handed parallel beta-helix repeat-containing protein, partial [bacterium]